MSRRIRILFGIDSFNSEAGTENQLIALIHGMDASRFEIFVFCIEDGEPLQRLAPRATPLVFPMTNVLSMGTVRQICRLHREINRLRIDIVHTFMVRPAILGVAATWRSRCKVVLTSRRNMGHWYTPSYLRMFRMLNRFTSRVVANSEAAKQAAVNIEGLDPSRVDVQYNGVNLRAFSGAGDRSSTDRLGIPSQARIVGIVANYRAVKDLPMFLRAAALIAAQHADVAFLLVGKGPLRQRLAELAEQLGIGQKVFFTDGIGSVSEYLPLMELGCLTSLNEGFSNAILEYMAAGLAVVATDVGGNREAVTDGVTGFLTPAGDEYSFARQVNTLLENDQMRKSMGERGRARCLEEFSMDACARRFENYYESFVESSLS